MTEIEESLRGRFAAERLPCELRTLSDALRRESIDRVDLIKIDVEKTELDVLAGIEDADWPPHPPAHDGAAPGLRAKGASSLDDPARGFDVTVRQDPTMAGADIHILFALRPASGDA